VSLWVMLSAALAVLSVSPAYAQIDLTAVKQAVGECVARVRQDANRPENYQYGQPPMWKNFDAYVAPNGLVQNNARFVGEQEGVYRFEKCLADYRISLSSPSANNPPPKPPDTCTQEELNFESGDCWVKLLAWEKRFIFTGFESGWLHSYEFAERQQYDRTGSSKIHFLPQFDPSKVILYFDQLYSAQENRTIYWGDAFDLLFRTQTNPETKDIPGLTALYRKHEKPLFSGYLRKFTPPNKVVISEFNYDPPNLPNRTITLTLLNVSTDPNTKSVNEFMTALLNVKQCNTLIHMKDAYKLYTSHKTDQEKQQAKELSEYAFYPQLKAVIQYPWVNWPDQQEEFFNKKNEFSGVVLLDKGQLVCIEKDGEGMKLGQLMQEGMKDQNAYSADPFRRDMANSFINLNQYLTSNGLRAVDSDEDDPRPAHKYFHLFNAEPAPDGVKKILLVGAAQ
jgi:hypothetical protein